MRDRQKGHIQSLARKSSWLHVLAQLRRQIPEGVQHALARVLAENWLVVDWRSVLSLLEGRVQTGDRHNLAGCFLFGVGERIPGESDAVVVLVLIEIHFPIRKLAPSLSFLFALFRTTQQTVALQIRFNPSGHSIPRYKKENKIRVSTQLFETFAKNRTRCRF